MSRKQLTYTISNSRRASDPFCASVSLPRHLIWTEQPTQQVFFLFESRVIVFQTNDTSERTFQIGLTNNSGEAVPGKLPGNDISRVMYLSLQNHSNSYPVIWRATTMGLSAPIESKAWQENQPLSLVSNQFDYIVKVMLMGADPDMLRLSYAKFPR